MTMEKEKLFQFNHYVVYEVTPARGERKHFDNGQPVNYMVFNEQTGLPEMYASTFVQTINMCIELSNAEDKASDYLASLSEDAALETEAETSKPH